MYTSYFGLRENPFNATPDPRFFYDNRGYREAYATLLYGIQERKGFVALTGEVGTGKTTLLRRLMDNLNSAIKVVFFYNTTWSFEEMVEFICAELKLAVSGMGRVLQLHALKKFLIAEAEQGGTVVFLIDEAQNLSPEALENLRLISNLETSTAKLLQIVLAGQPELESKLADPSLRQVTQRIALRSRLERLSDAEIEPFIDHRLRVAGGTRRELFSDGAIRRVTSHAGGLPRLINILCDNALLLAYATDAKRVTERMIDEAATDLRLHGSAGLASGPAERYGRSRGGLRSQVDAPSDSRRGWIAVVSAVAIANVVITGVAGSLGLWWYLSWTDSPKDRTAMAGQPSQVVEVSPGRLSAPSPGSSAPLVAETLLAAAPAAVAAPTDVPTLRPQRPTPGSESVSPHSPARPTSHAGGSTGDGRRSERSTADIAGRRMTVPRGATLSQIAFAHYGGYDSLALDLIHELNPALRDIDVVMTGEPLWLPPLTLETRVRRQPDGYRLIVTSEPTVQAAEQAAARIRRLGYAVTVTSREVASSRALHRVEIVSLNSHEAAVRAWETVGRLGGLDPRRDAAARRR